MKNTGLADSPLFQKPTSQSAPIENHPDSEQKVERHTVTPVNQYTVTPSHHHTSSPVNQYTVTPSHRHTSTPERPKKKHGFVVYLDQITALDNIVLAQWQKTGQKPEIGAIVREALDRMIEQKKEELGI